jgi:hypothetical protein
MRSKISIFAKLDTMHVLDGLFVPVAKKGEALFDVESEIKGGIARFEGVQLDVKHQSVLLAIMARGARAGKNNIVIDSSVDDLLAKKARLSLSLAGATENSSMGTVKCTAYGLLTDAGLDTSKKGYVELKKLLVQLSTVKLCREVEGDWGTSSVIGNVGGDDEGNIVVAINWKLAGALTGGQNIHVNLIERHQLSSSPVAKILHTWLSAYIRPGAGLMSNKGAELDTLAKHVWGKRACSQSVTGNRRVRIREALAFISKLNGWVVRIDRTHAYITRPKLLYDVFELPGELAEFLDDTFGLIETNHGKPDSSSRKTR